MFNPFSSKIGVKSHPQPFLLNPLSNEVFSGNFISSSIPEVIIHENAKLRRGTVNLAAVGSQGIIHYDPLQIESL